jgi:lipopolysaccharide transport system permease protein
MSTPSTFLEQLNLKRDLWWQFTTRAIEMRHRGSYLGFIWAVLNPLLMAALYVTVFGVIFQRKFGVTPDETAADYAIGVFLGLILFHVVTETISAAPSCIVGQPNLVKKVVFPLAVLPLAQLGSLWFHALISLALFVLASFVLGHGVSLSGIIWLPVILLPHLLLTLGLGWFLASTGVFFRDIAQVMPLFAQVLLYSSALGSPQVESSSPYHRSLSPCAPVGDAPKPLPLNLHLDLRHCHVFGRPSAIPRN